MKARRIIVTVILICAVIATSLSLFACDELPHVHNFSEWIETTPASCTSKGEKRRDCLDCDYYEIAAIDEIPHIYSEWSESKTGTCLEKGEMERHCLECGHVDTMQTNNGEHRFSDWSESKAGTCLEKGEMERHCLECQYSETMETTYGDHKYSEWKVAVPASCTTAGEMRRECVLCHHPETSVINELGHQYNDFHVTTEATCSHAGEKQKECARCGDIVKETIPEAEHTYLGEWTRTNTQHYRVCDKCGLKDANSVADHSFTAEGGTKCSVCGYIKLDNILIFTKNTDEQSYSVGYSGDITEIPEEIVIPDEYDGLPVTEIMDYAFTTGDSTIFSPLRQVTFGKNIKRIGVSAFWHNTNLTDPVLPDSLEKIDKYAFSQCFGIKHITFGEGLRIVEEQAFWNCYSLLDLNLPASLKRVEPYAFIYNYSLKTVKFNGALDYLGEQAFYDCRELTDVDLGNGELVTGNWVFQGCKVLENVTVGDNVRGIGEDIFYGLTTVRFNNKDGVDYLGNDKHPYVVAIKADSGITAYTSDEATRVIAPSAFYYCNNLGSVTLGSRVYSVGKYAFFDCTALETVTFKGDIKEIGHMAFYDCEQISKVYAPSVDSWLGITFSCTDDDDQRVHHVETNPLCYGADLIVDGSAVTEITVSGDITKISPYAFVEYDKLTAVHIGADVTDIGDFAFLHCKNLTEITVAGDNKVLHAEGNCVVDGEGNLVAGCAGSIIPNGVVDIPDYAFYGMQFTSTALVIPDTVEHIGRYAFFGTNLKKLTMGLGLKRADFWAFAGRVDEVHIKDIAQWATIDFEEESSSPFNWETRIYLNDTPLYNNTLEIPAGVKEIKPWTFANMGIYGLKIPASVTKIAPTAFAKTCNLNSEIIIDPDNQSYKLTANGLGIIEKDTNTLLLCKSYSNAKVDFTSEKFTSVAPYAFANRIIHNVALPSTVAEIGEYAFSLASLEQIDLGSGLKRIGNNAFAGNGNLKTITIPSSCTYIGDNAFIPNASEPAGLETAYFEDYDGWTVAGFAIEGSKSVDFSNPTSAAKQLKESAVHWQKSPKS